MSGSSDFVPFVNLPILTLLSHNLNYHYNKFYNQLIKYLTGQVDPS